jgi:hypothetical protein
VLSVGHERILEWGDQSDYEELIRYYGWDRIVEALRKEYVYLPNYIMVEVAQYFELKKEEMEIWRRKQKKMSMWV